MDTPKGIIMQLQFMTSQVWPTGLKGQKQVKICLILIKSWNNLGIFYPIRLKLGVETLKGITFNTNMLYKNLEHDYSMNRIYYMCLIVGSLYVPGKTHNSSRNGGEKDEEHQSFFGVEIDDDKIRIFRIIIAGINGSGCVIATISAVKVVKSHAFVFEGIDAPCKRKI